MTVYLDTEARSVSSPIKPEFQSRQIIPMLDRDSQDGTTDGLIQDTCEDGGMRQWLTRAGAGSEVRQTTDTSTLHP